MDLDIVIVGGGLGGSTLATLMARAGKRVLLLERDAKFKDRIRGENMLPWGVAIARRLGILDDLVKAGGVLVPFFSVYTMGQGPSVRPMPQTTPHGESLLNIYHPDLQEVLLAGAVKAGAEVKRGVNATAISEPNASGRRAVTYVENGAQHSVEARVVVGADGRSSRAREWGGFTVERDANNLRIAGALMEGLAAPEDSFHVAFGPGVASIFVPLGKGRARAYVAYPGATGDRKLSGKEKAGAFIEGLRASLIPSTWLESAAVVGPLAEFEGADHWVTSPAKKGLALVGDAAGASDPTWGCGLSKTLLDTDTLATCLSETDDWDAALSSYAKKHDDHFGKLHDILAAMTHLFWAPGADGDALRQKVLGKMRENPMAGWPDVTGLGPLGPADEKACNLLRGIGLD